MTTNADILNCQVGQPPWKPRVDVKLVVRRVGHESQHRRWRSPPGRQMLKPVRDLLVSKWPNFGPGQCQNTENVRLFKRGLARGGIVFEGRASKALEWSTRKRLPMRVLKNLCTIELLV